MDVGLGEDAVHHTVLGDAQPLLLLRAQVEVDVNDVVARRGADDQRPSHLERGGQQPAGLQRVDHDGGMTNHCGGVG